MRYDMCINKHNYTVSETYPTFFLYFLRHSVKRWQLALHCHLRTLVPLVVFGFNYKASSADHNAPAYQISTKSGNAMLSWLFNLLSPPPFRGDFVAPFSDGWTWRVQTVVLGLCEYSFYYSSILYRAPYRCWVLDWYRKYLVTIGWSKTDGNRVPYL